MAGEIESGWVKIGLELSALLVSFGGLGMYVKQKLKAHDSQLIEHKAMITDLQTKQANNVRPADIAQLHKRLEDQDKANSAKLDLIVALIQAKK